MRDLTPIGMPPMNPAGPTRQTVVAHMARAIRVGAPAMANLTPAEWTAVPAQAEAHGLAGAVGTWLPLAPPSVRPALEDYVQRTEARETALRRDLTALDVAFAARGVQARWLKGAALWSTDLPRSRPRPTADLDVLVSAPDEPGAWDALRTLGYRRAGASWKHAGWIRPGNTAVVDPRGEHPNNPRPVEVHPAIREAFRGISVDLTQAAVTDGLRGILLHLAVHATADALQRKLRLLGLLDLKHLAEAADESDWRWLVDWADPPGRTRWLWPSLALAAKWVDAPVPETILSALADRAGLPLRLWAAGRDPDWLSVAGRESRPRPATQVLQVWPITWRETLTVARFLVVPSPAQLADRYPGRADRQQWVTMYARHSVYLLRQLRLIARRRVDAGSQPGRS